MRFHAMEAEICAFQKFMERAIMVPPIERYAAKSAPIHVKVQRNIKLHQILLIRPSANAVTKSVSQSHAYGHIGRHFPKITKFQNLSKRVQDILKTISLLKTGNGQFPRFQCFFPNVYTEESKK